MNATERYRPHLTVLCVVVALGVGVFAQREQRALDERLATAERQRTEAAAEREERYRRGEISVAQARIEPTAGAVYGPLASERTRERLRIRAIRWFSYATLVSAVALWVPPPLRLRVLALCLLASALGLLDWVSYGRKTGAIIVTLVSAYGGFESWLRASSKRVDPAVDSAGSANINPSSSNDNENGAA